MEDLFRYMAPVIPFDSNIIKSGKGNYLYTTTGKKILDLNSGQFCTVFGHSNEALCKVIEENARNLQHTCSSCLAESVLKAAKKVNQISGVLDARTLFLSTGSEAVETCLRYAKHITSRDGVICFSNGYHGLSLGSQGITFSGIYSRPRVASVYGIEPPSNVEKVDEALDKLKEILNKHGYKIAVMLVEPIVSVGGLIYPPFVFFEKAKMILDEYGVLLAFDESQTGFGRTGKWFAYQHMKCVPDFVICSKAMGLGYPVSALLFNGKLVDNTEITMTHYSSHQNDPLAGDIVQFEIDYFIGNNLIERIISLGEYFLEKLKMLEDKYLYFDNARGIGLMLGLDFKIPDVKDYRPIYKKFHDIAENNGVLLQATDGERVLRFLPSYLTTEREVDFCIEMLEKTYIETFETGN